MLFNFFPTERNVTLCWRQQPLPAGRTSPLRYTVLPFPTYHNVLCADFRLRHGNSPKPAAQGKQSSIEVCSFLDSAQLQFLKILDNLANYDRDTALYPRCVKMADARQCENRIPSTACSVWCVVCLEVKMRLYWITNTLQ